MYIDFEKSNQLTTMHRSSSSVCMLVIFHRCGIFSGTIQSTCTTHSSQDQREPRENVLPVFSYISYCCRRCCLLAMENVNIYQQNTEYTQNQMKFCFQTRDSAAQGGMEAGMEFSWAELSLRCPTRNIMKRMNVDVSANKRTHLFWRKMEYDMRKIGIAHNQTFNQAKLK